MSIIGIDKKKCSNCKQCIQECGRGYFFVNKDGDVTFNENLGTCNICGHCIAICSEDAIITKGLDDVDTFTGIDSPESIVGYDKIFQLIRAKRSTRRYKSKTVPKDILESR